MQSVKNIHKTSLSPLQKNFSDILGESNFEELAALSKLRRAWHSIVGPMMALRTEPTHLEFGDQGKILWIAVYHSTLAQQITFLRDDIRKACSKHCNLHQIIRIRTRVQSDAGIALPAKREPLPPISFNQCREVASALCSVKDKALRRAMFQARVAQLSFLKAEGIV